MWCRFGENIGARRSRLKLLTRMHGYDIICHMAPATLLLHRRRIFDDGAIEEMKLWQVSTSVRGSDHAFKYSLFYGREAYASPHFRLNLSRNKRIRMGVVSFRKESGRGGLDS